MKTDESLGPSTATGRGSSSEGNDYAAKLEYSDSNYSQDDNDVKVEASNEKVQSRKDKVMKH